MERPEGGRLAFVVSHPSTTPATKTCPLTPRTKTRPRGPVSLGTPGRDETARWMGHAPFWGGFDAVSGTWSHSSQVRRLMACRLDHAMSLCAQHCFRR